MDLKLLAATIAVLASICSGIAIVDAQEKCLGGGGNDFAYSINQTDDGGYIVAGATESSNGDVSSNYGGYDAWVVKLNSAEGLQWQKSLGGSGADIAYSILQTNDGGYIAAGATDSNDGNVKGNHGGNDTWIIKLNPAGDIIEWQRCLGGSDNDYARSIRPTSDGGYIVAGYTDSNNGNVSGNHGASDAWVIKLSPTGRLQWQKCLGGSDDDRAYSAQQTNDGGYIVAGYTNSNDDDVTDNYGGYDAWVVKLNSTGGLQWQKCLGGSGDDRAYSIQQTNEGDYIIAGYTFSSDGSLSGLEIKGNYDAWVIKLDRNGNNISWQNRSGGGKPDYAYSIQQTADGGYILAGTTNSNEGDVKGNHGKRDYWAVKLNSIGELQWQQCLGGSNNEGSDNEKACSIQQIKDGSYILAGSTSSNDGDVSGNHGGYDAWVVKLMPPVITTQPVSQTICAGNAASFSVVATGVQPLYYQWKKNGSIINGATASTHLANGAGTYTVDVSNKYGNITSNAATLTINKPVAIAAQPEGRTVCAGQTVSFRVIATGTGPLSYQWKKGGSDLSNMAERISGVTTDTLTIKGVTMADAGDYTVVVSGICGSPANSNVATLILNSPPLILTKLENKTVCQGGTATFSITATGTGLAYRWYKGSNALTNGGHISGATGSTLNISSADSSDAAYYHVVVSGSCSPAATSDTVHLTVNSPPSILTQPKNKVVCLGTSAAFIVEASGTGLSYQWKKDGLIIGEATTPTLSIASAKAGDAGTYTVDVSNSCGKVTSDAATLSVNIPVAITTQPASRTVCAGQAVSFKVITTGTGPLSYQWKRGGSDLGNVAERISGVTTATLTINGVTKSDAGDYTVVVSGLCGSPATSNVATLSLNSAPSISIQPENKMVCPGGTAAFSVTATGTNLSYRWKKGGSDLGNVAEHISGVTTATLTIKGVTMADAGDYTVVVSGICGSPATSNVATLRLNSAPSISTQPENKTVCPGGTATFSVTAAGTGLSYQWYKGSKALTNGDHISGATDSTLTISSADSSYAADYHVVVSGSCSPAVTSDTVHLTRNTPPTIFGIQPSGQTVRVGDRVSFRVVATGTEPFSFQWKKDGSPIEGKTGPIFWIPSATKENAGNYEVDVSNVCDRATSNKAALIVNPPIITFTWDYKTFPGFYYDIDNDVGTEQITITLSNVGANKATATLSDEEVNGQPRGVVYKTEAKPLPFKFKEWGSYNVIGFLCEKYFAGYRPYSYLYDQSTKKILMANEQISKVLMDDNTERTITSDNPLTLGEGYRLAIKSIDTYGNKVYLELSKNGQVVDSKVIQPMINNAKDKTYYYKTTIGDTTDIIQIAVHFKNAFAGADANIATIDGVFQISDTPASIKVDQQYDKLSIRAINPNAMTITMDNKDNQITLSKNKDTLLMPNIHIRTADQDATAVSPLRWQLYKSSTIASGAGSTNMQETEIDIRGAIHNLGDASATWDSSAFAGFYYDINQNIGTESLTFTLTGSDPASKTLSDVQDAAGNRGVVYQTTAQSENFKFKQWGEYKVIGFLAERYFAAYSPTVTPAVNAADRSVPYLYDVSRNINMMKNEQVSKVLVDDDTERTITSANPLKLEEGYELAIKSIDTYSNRVYLELSKNGQVVDSKVIQPSVDNAQMKDKTYYYKTKIGDTTDIVQIAAHFKNAFRGADANIATIDGVFQISDTPAPLKVDQQYDKLSIRAINPNAMTITMDNKDNQITLSKNKDTVLMQNIYIKTADQDTIDAAQPLRYYIYKKLTEPKTYEIRGTVADLGTG